MISVTFSDDVSDANLRLATKKPDVSITAKKASQGAPEFVSVNPPNTKRESVSFLNAVTLSDLVEPEMPAYAFWKSRVASRPFTF